MANTDNAIGLRPVRHLSGGCVRANEYSIASAYNTSIFTGDVVEMTGTGKNIAVAAAENVDNIGVFAGVSYVNAAGKQIFSKYWPADTVATKIKATVYDDPQLLFRGQCDDVAAGDIGALVDYDDGSGSTTTGLSGREIVATTGTGGKALRLMGLIDEPDNAYGAYADVEVMFAEHALSGVVLGVGGV